MYFSVAVTVFFSFSQIKKKKAETDEGKKKAVSSTVKNGLKVVQNPAEKKSSLNWKKKRVLRKTNSKKETIKQKVTGINYVYKYGMMLHSQSQKKKTLDPAYFPVNSRRANSSCSRYCDRTKGSASGEKKEKAHARRGRVRDVNVMIRKKKNEHNNSVIRIYVYKPGKQKKKKEDSYLQR